MAALNSETIRSWSVGYSYQSFQIVTTVMEFEFSRRAIENGSMHVPSNTSAVWCPYLQEVLAGGVLQGRKKRDPRGASGISRLKMWTAVMETFNLRDDIDNLAKDIDSGTYKHIKQHRFLDPRRVVKETVTGALQGWISNGGDDQFSINEKD
jgi:tRNA-specific adenosine deaminase 1